MVFRRIDEELQSQASVHIIQSCSQDSLAVVLMIQHPEVTTAYFRKENADCYHCASTVLFCTSIEKFTGIQVARFNFSDPKGGIRALVKG